MHFRRRFGEQFEGIFLQVLGVARENPLSRFGAVSLDGTKIQATASRHSALSLADTGYFSEENVRACHEAGIDPLIAMGRDKHHPGVLERIEEPAPKRGPLTCVEQMKQTLKSKAGRAIYGLRKQTVEPVFGIIKSVMGFRQFPLRGIENTRNEWMLVCLAWNLKRMAVLRPKSAQMA